MPSVLALVLGGDCTVLHAPGDMHYADLVATNHRPHLTATRNVIAQSKQKLCMLLPRSEYTWSDHDFTSVAITLTRPRTGGIAPVQASNLVLGS
jgi:hypothetical protein